MKYIEDLKVLKNKTEYPHPARDMIKDMNENVKLWFDIFNDNPVNFYRNTVIVRKIGNDVQFGQSWSFHKE